MSKKSYKRNQNRLYREIKRRIIAEGVVEGMLKHPAFPAEKKTIDVVKIRSIFPNYLADQMEFVKQDTAMKITKQLIDDGYVAFFSKGQDSERPIDSCTEVEAKVYVVRPETENGVIF